MGKFIDLTGKQFERLKVIKRAENGNCSGRPTTRWVCKCDCGKVVNIEGHSLKRGRTKSCGCLNNETRSKLLTTISITHGKSYSRVYHIWASMKQRCLNLNNAKYSIYGGRGIVVCEEWRNSFINFYNWSMSNGYKDNLTIDRINNNGNYEPSNCRWANWHIQRINQRRMVVK